MYKMFSPVPVATSPMSEKKSFFSRPPTYGICDLNDSNIKNHNCSIGVVWISTLYSEDLNPPILLTTDYWSLKNLFVRLVNNKFYKNRDNNSRHHHTSLWPTLKTEIMLNYLSLCLIAPGEVEPAIGVTSPQWRCGSCGQLFCNSTRNP